MAKKAKNVKELWEQAWSEHGIGKIPTTEHRFHDVRKFRWDYAWPNIKVAVETDGFGMGHQSKWALSNDHTKTNLGQECGWVVIRFTARDLGSKQKRHDCAKQVLRIIKRRRLECAIAKQNGTLASVARYTKGVTT